MNLLLSLYSSLTLEKKTNQRKKLAYMMKIRIKRMSRI